MNALTAALKEELNVEMISIGGLQIPESVVVSWGIMAFLVICSILLTRNLRVDHITKRQAILETVVTFINDFFVGLLGEKGKRYVPYLISVALYIACSSAARNSSAVSGSGLPFMLLAACDWAMSVSKSASPKS